jgi:hypothetical protein
VPELYLICTDAQRRQEATAWLMERGDLRELHEQRLETAEWAILIFLAAGVALDVMLVAHDLLALKLGSYPIA